LTNIGELLFFAFFAEAPLIVPDDSTRAMFCDHGYTVRSAAGYRRATRRRLSLSRRLLAC
jgi:hypothetical protein